MDMNFCLLIFVLIVNYYFILFLYVHIGRHFLKNYTKSTNFDRLRLERGNQLLVGQELGVIKFVCQSIDILPQS